MKFLTHIFLFTAFVFSESVELKWGEPKRPNPLILGVNENVVNTTGEPAEIAMWRLVRPTLIRHPGGTVASYWDWKTGGLVPVKQLFDALNGPIYAPSSNSMVGMYPRVEANRKANKNGNYSVDGFVAFAKKIDAQVVWILNTMTDAPENLIAQVEYLKSKQYPLDFIELGNENNGSIFKGRFPAVEDYYREMSPIVKNIRDISPSTQLAYPSAVEMCDKMDSDTTIGQGDERHEHWMRWINAQNDGVHSVSHKYQGAAHADPGFAKAFADLSEKDLAVFLLQSPEYMIRNAADSMRGKNKEIWFTEYNLWVQNGVLSNYAWSWTQALYMAHWQLRLLVHPSFKMALYHSFSGAQFSLVRPNKDSPEYPYRVSPAAELFSQIAESVRGAESATTVLFTAEPSEPGKLRWEKSGPSSKLIGLRLDKKGEKHLIVLNLSKGEIAVKSDFLSGENPARAFSISSRKLSGEILKAIDPKTTSFPLTAPIEPQTISTASGMITLPPFSFCKWVW